LESPQAFGRHDDLPGSDFDEYATEMSVWGKKSMGPEDLMAEQFCAKRSKFSGRQAL